MELRDIEIFLTLAEELHFGRTAQRLCLSQARVSQAVGLQERRLGGALFDRSNRRQIRLTPLGRQLREDLQPIYAGLRDSIERARLAARGIASTLRLGMIPFNTYDLRPYWDTFRSRYPQWDLQIRRASFVDPFAALRTGELDALIAWLPVEEPDLTVGPILLSDRRVLAVSAGRELAERSSVSVELLAEFTHGMAPGVPDYWEDAYLPFATPGGRTIPRGPLVSTPEELIHHVAAGETVQVFPLHVTSYWAMPDVRWLPVIDMPRLSYALLWRTENDAVRGLAHVIRDLGILRR